VCSVGVRLQGWVSELGTDACYKPYRLTLVVGRGGGSPAHFTDGAAAHIIGDPLHIVEAHDYTGFHQVAPATFARVERRTARAPTEAAAAGLLVVHAANFSARGIECGPCLAVVGGTPIASSGHADASRHLLITDGY